MAMYIPPINELAAKVHRTWCHTKCQEGYATIKTEWGEERLVTYEQLSEPAKEITRANVRAVLAELRELSPDAAAAEVLP